MFFGMYIFAFIEQMRVSTTNLAELTTIVISGKERKTGIYKYPTSEGICLGLEDVENDCVIDRQHHGGVDKACYVYSLDAYAKWQGLYPDLAWGHGMFGENLTLEDCDEREVYVGDQYAVGTAIVEVSEPRHPCNILGVRFGSADMIRQFINQPHCGFYLRVIQEGKVLAGQEMKLVKRVQKEFSISRLFWLRHNATIDDLSELDRAVNVIGLANSAKDSLSKKIALISN